MAAVDVAELTQAGARRRQEVLIGGGGAKPPRYDGPAPRAPGSPLVAGVAVSAPPFFFSPGAFRPSEARAPGPPRVPSDHGHFGPGAGAVVVSTGAGVVAVAARAGG